MREYCQFFIDGEWVAPHGTEKLDVVNPATEEVCGEISLASAQDVDNAVAAARRAFADWSQSAVAERIELLERIKAEYERRSGDLAVAVTEEMGAPIGLSRAAQVPTGLGHLNVTIDVLKNFAFEQNFGSTLIRKEPIGVCGLITPWNWPLNQIAVKVFPAIAAGCTVVLKPSEISPFSAQIFAEIMQEAGTPQGVFNMINGDGKGAGSALSGHRDVDMISFTGSTRAGVEIARNAALTVKRVCQELGGKGPNIILDDSSFQANVAKGVQVMMSNSGQTCIAPSRMLVPKRRMDEAIAAAKMAVETISVGDPLGNSMLGPLVSQTQFERVQKLIRHGVEEGATLVAGGLGRPDGVEKGYYTRPTVFGHVKNDMTIAREEIFGPVLCIIAYETPEHAVEIANDTPFGLSAFVFGEYLYQARQIACQLRAGQVCINDFTRSERTAPFGGYKQSGNGREWGEYGLNEYLETKSILGYGPEPCTSSA